MIEIRSVTKRFEDFEALHAITCQIRDGCIYGMVGANGAGKSTFLRILNDVYRPEEGTVLVDGEDLRNNPLAKKKMIYVPDDLFFLNQSDMERMALFYKRMYQAFDRSVFDMLVAQFGLDVNKPIADFSKGMRRQAAIILALSVKTKYMFFDETFDGLDPVMRQLVKEYIQQRVRQDKGTVIVTSHSLRELEDICEHLSLLHKGGLIVDSDMEELKERYVNIQVVFDKAYTQDKFAGIDMIEYSQRGLVANFVIDGKNKSGIEAVRALNPILLELLPLSVEQVFALEMERLGYKFDTAKEHYE